MLAIKLGYLNPTFVIGRVQLPDDITNSNR